MRPEILAPAGNQEALDAALAAGCDAVYFGMNAFGARAFAQNFTLDQAKENIKKCHTLGVKVHVTMNTIIYEDEMEDAYQMAKSLYEIGVDALIVQDLGLIHLLHHRLPKLVIHASTQMSVMDAPTIERLKKMGVQRVVLARECTKEQVLECKKAGLEIEIFAHGAICISQSGRCYLSSACYNRSGNRGMCAQPCRMEYQLYQDGKRIQTPYTFLLSPKDLSMIDIVDQLEVDSLKIEGRMKSPAYVYEAVTQVRKMLDEHTRTKEDKERIRYTFNREYTLGHYSHQKGQDLMNMSTSNHQGVEIGVVTNVSKSYIEIQLKKPLYQNDGIRIGKDVGFRVNYLYDSSLRLQNHIDANQVALLKSMEGVQKGDIVRKTISYSLEQDIQSKIAQTQRKVVVPISIACQGIGQPLTCIVLDQNKEIKISSSYVAQEAMNRPTDEEVIRKQLGKTGNTWVMFDFQEINVADHVYFTIKDLNAFRREIIDVITQERVRLNIEDEQPYDFIPEVSAPDKAMYTESLPSDCANADWNIVNSYAIAACLEMGYKSVTMSDECDVDASIHVAHTFYERYGVYAPIIKKVYHKQRYMIMQHCPVNTLLKDGQRKGCALCHQHRFELENGDVRMTCIGDANCNMRLYAQNPSNVIDEVPRLLECGIKSFYVEFIDEKKSEKNHICDSLKAYLY